MYDITKRSTFLSLQKWIEEVRRYTSSNVIVSLIGNKCDLNDQREVEPDEPKSFCRYIPEIMFVMETSAKDNTNVEDTFRGLATELKVIIMLTYINLIGVLEIILPFVHLLFLMLYRSILVDNKC